MNEKRIDQTLCANSKNVIFYKLMITILISFADITKVQEEYRYLPEDIMTLLLFFRHFLKFMVWRLFMHILH